MTGKRQRALRRRINRVARQAALASPFTAETADFWRGWWRRYAASHPADAWRILRS